MSELVFHKIQLGAESTEGTGVAATVIFPTDPGAVTELDRAPLNPDEDYGTISKNNPNRGAYGVRGARLSMPGYLRFQDAMRLFEMAIAGGVTPTVSNGSNWQWTYSTDMTSDSLKAYTIEEGTSDGQTWQVPGALISDLELGYDALSAPGDAPWKFTATVIGRNRTKTSFTSSLSAPSNMETMQGHLTQLYEGSGSTAFASLPELSNSLLMYKVKIANDVKLRPYGSTSDVATSHGRGKRDITFEAMVKIATTATTDTFDIFNTGVGTSATERRWRIKVNGSAGNWMQVDHRIRFTAIPLGDRDGEQVYHLQGVLVSDSALTGSADMQILLTNAIANLP